jgi:hypothetical protein
MGTDSSPWLPDHNTQVKAARSCCARGQTYTHGEVQEDYAWEPTRPGWSCGASTRPRRRAVQQAALELVERAEPRWRLVLTTPLHEVHDVCLECEAAQSILLGHGGPLARAESKALSAAVRSASRAGERPEPTPVRGRSTACDEHGAQIVAVLCVTDREAGGAESLPGQGLELRSVFSMTGLQAAARSPS